MGRSVGCHRRCRRLSRRVCAENVAFEPGVSERLAWVESVDEADEVGVTRIQRCDGCRFGHEEFAPVRASAERRQRHLEPCQGALDSRLITVPGEVDAYRVAPVLRTHPQMVRSDRADLAHVQEWPDGIGELTHRCDRRHRVLARDEQLGLQLVAVARREAHPEVGKPI